MRKNLTFKLRSTPKREIFLQDKIKNHGKAGACRDFLNAVLWEKIRFGAYNSLCETAFDLLFFATAVSKETQTENRSFVISIKSKSGI